MNTIIDEEIIYYHVSLNTLIKAYIRENFDPCMYIIHSLYTIEKVKYPTFEHLFI